jgi:hypothetical protein
MSIKHHTFAAAFALAALAPLASACSKAKEEAIAGAAQIDAACKAKKDDEASKLGADFYAKNEVFKKAVDGAAGTWKVSDVSKFNYCGVAFVEVKSRIEN